MLNKYETYKDAEVELLNPIPSHWQIKRVKDISTVISKGTTPTTEGAGFTDFGVRFLKAENITENGSINKTPMVFISDETDKLLSRSRLKQNDLLIVIAGATTGKIAILPKEILPANTNQAVCFIRLHKYEQGSFLKYKQYALNSPYFQRLVWLYAVTSAQPNLPMAVLSRMHLHYPPLEEQTSIAEYLETKTQTIDKKVSLLEKKIGYYHELRKSLIIETVTKGLDKNAELQTNELGFATPKKWLRYRLKDLGALYSGLSGKSGDDFNQDDNPDNKGFIPFTNIANNTYLKRDHLGTVVVYEGEKQNRVRKGDIFFLMSSEGYEDIGKSAALAEDIEETYLNSFCKGYRVNPRKTNPYFLNYLMLSDYYRQLLIVEGKGFTRINLKMEKVNDFLVYIPHTLSAQEEIVKFLDTKLDTIAKIIANIQTQITTLKELRKTLINDVVTGKIKVSHE